MLLKAGLTTQVEGPSGVILFQKSDFWAGDSDCYLAGRQGPNSGRRERGQVGGPSPRLWPRHSGFLAKLSNPAPRVVRSVAQSGANHEQVWVSGSQSSF